MFFCLGHTLCFLFFKQHFSAYSKQDKKSFLLFEKKCSLLLNGIMLLSTEICLTCATDFLPTFHQNNPTYTMKEGPKCPFLYAQKSSGAKATIFKSIEVHLAISVGVKPVFKIF